MRPAAGPGAVRGDAAACADVAMQALLSTPPLALATFAFCVAALLVERIALVWLRGAAAPALLTPFVFWLAIASALGAFWLLNALRLAGLVSSPPNRLTSLGALATAALGAFLARLELGPGPGTPLALALSATCFATAFLLHVAPHRHPETRA